MLSGHALGKGKKVVPESKALETGAVAGKRFSDWTCRSLKIDGGKSYMSNEKNGNDKWERAWTLLGEEVGTVP